MIDRRTYDASLKKNEKRIRSVVKDYLKTQNQKNVHSLRTSIRRFDAMVGILPKKLRKKSGLAEYTEQLGDLLRLNTEARDYDVILSKLREIKPASAYNQKLVVEIERSKKRKLAIAERKALSVTKLDVPRVKTKDVSDEKMEKRFEETIRKLDSQIVGSLSHAFEDPKNVDELHSARKSCKKIRFVLELTPRKYSKLIKLLVTWQDTLGSIHDSDVFMAFISKKDFSPEKEMILRQERSKRDQGYENFVSLFKSEYGKEIPTTLLTTTKKPENSFASVPVNELIS